MKGLLLAMLLLASAAWAKPIAIWQGATMPGKATGQAEQTTQPQGYVTNVSLDETGVAKYAALEASCNLDGLEQVFVITDYAGS